MGSNSTAIGKGAEAVQGAISDGGAAGGVDSVTLGNSARQSGRGTMSLLARVGDKSTVSAGMGIGLNSGAVGACGGFQVEW